MTYKYSFARKWTDYDAAATDDNNGMCMCLRLFDSEFTYYSLLFIIFPDVFSDAMENKFVELSSGNYISR